MRWIQVDPSPVTVLGVVLQCFAGHAHLVTGCANAVNS